MSQATDVYSFGVLLVALFTGEVSWGVPLPSEPSARVQLLRTLSMSGRRPLLPADVKARTGSCFSCAEGFFCCGCAVRSRAVPSTAAPLAVLYRPPSLATAVVAAAIGACLHGAQSHGAALVCYGVGGTVQEPRDASA